MNYISHYFLDSLSGQPYYNLGLALPDLMGSAQRKWKPVLRQGAEHAGEAGRNVWLGISAHLDADALFHNSDFFKEQTREIRQRLEKHGLAGQGARLFFVAHICLELMLDRLIVKSFPGMADRFYYDLEGVDHTVIGGELSNAVNPDYGNFFQLFERFCQARYLYTYQEDDRILFALNRIIGRTGQSAFEESTGERLKEAMLETEEVLEKVYLDFFGWMKDQLMLHRASNLPS